VRDWLDFDKISLRTRLVGALLVDARFSLSHSLVTAPIHLLHPLMLIPTRDFNLRTANIDAKDKE
jgi:hypothetical protein